MNLWIKPKLGDWITVFDKYIRVKSPVVSTPGYRSSNRIWKLQSLEPPLKVLVVGKRTISDGRADWDSETGYEYSPKEFMTALLVVSAMNKKPFLVPYAEQPKLRSSLHEGITSEEMDTKFPEYSLESRRAGVFLGLDHPYTPGDPGL